MDEAHRSIGTLFFYASDFNMYMSTATITKMRNTLSTANLRIRLGTITRTGLKTRTSAKTIHPLPALLCAATRARSAAMLRSCLNAIADGEVPASVATMIDSEVLQAEEELFLAEANESYVKEFLWENCGLLEIAAFVDAEMHRLQHPTGCEDRATCQQEREVREKRALALAYESLRAGLVKKRPFVQVREMEDYDSDSTVP